MKLSSDWKTFCLSHPFSSRGTSPHIVSNINIIIGDFHKFYNRNRTVFVYVFENFRIKHVLIDLLSNFSYVSYFISANIHKIFHSIPPENWINYVTIQISFVKPLLTQLKFYSLRLLCHIKLLFCMNASIHRKQFCMALNSY